MAEGSKWEAVPAGVYRSWTDIRNPRTIYSHHDDFGFPCRGRQIDVTEVIRHLHRFLVDNQSVLADASGSAADANSEMVRQRAAKADLLEMERDEKRGHLLPKSVVHGLHVQFAARLRKASDQLGRRFGAKAQSILQDALSDCEQIIERGLGG